MSDDALRLLLTTAVAQLRTATDLTIDEVIGLRILQLEGLRTLPESALTPEVCYSLGPARDPSRPRSADDARALTTSRILSARMISRGSKIGRFTVVTELGSGGMGAVYAAHDPQLDRQVALKVLRDASGGEEDRVRLMREGQAMARVTHPNVITVYEVGTEGDSVFLAQELLDGGTLKAWLEKP